MYEDETKSTPLLVLEKAIKNRDKSKMLVTLFNDGNPDYIEKLQKNIEQLEGYDELRYEPEYINIVMDSDSKIVEELELATTKLIPTLFFIDPFGYQGLSLTLIHSVLKDWGSDGIFFFNYKRINMAISNTFMQPHMEILFGKERLNELRRKVGKLASSQREELILDYLTEAIKDIGGHYILVFRFPDYAGTGTRTSHYLIFVSKNIKGYHAMKDILARNSSSYVQGVASYEFDPNIQYTLGLSLRRPLDKLKTMLITDFNKREIMVNDLYLEHDIGEQKTRYYTISNYKDALLELESEGKIEVDKSPNKRQKRNGKLTLGDKRKVKFL
jgi:three-Cys-motif partner protein